MQTRNGIRLAQRIYLPLLFLMLSVAAIARQSRTPSPTACPGPTNDVIVMALQDPDNEQANLIVVKNRSRYPIVALTVGDGSKPQLRIADFAVPVRILGPAGWTGTHVFKEESMFMHWAWTVKKPEDAIAPEEMASEFKVILPQFPSSSQGKLYMDGTQIQPIKVSNLPFRVQFANGTCAWGEVRPLIIGAS